MRSILRGFNLKRWCRDYARSYRRWKKPRKLFWEEPGLDRGNVELLCDSKPPGDPMLADELFRCFFLPLKYHWDFSLSTVFPLFSAVFSHLTFLQLIGHRAYSSWIELLDPSASLCSLTDIWDLIHPLQFSCFSLFHSAGDGNSSKSGGLWMCLESLLPLMKL